MVETVKAFCNYMSPFNLARGKTREYGAWNGSPVRVLYASAGLKAKARVASVFPVGPFASAARKVEQRKAAADSLFYDLLNATWGDVGMARNLLQNILYDGIKGIEKNAVMWGFTRAENDATLHLVDEVLFKVMKDLTLKRPHWSPSKLRSVAHRYAEHRASLASKVRETCPEYSADEVKRAVENRSSKMLAGLVCLEDLKDDYPSASQRQKIDELSDAIFYPFAPRYEQFAIGGDKKLLPNESFDSRVVAMSKELKPFVKKELERLAKEELKQAQH